MSATTSWIVMFAITGAVVVALGVLAYRAATRRLRRAIAFERETGNLRVRRRTTVLVGRKKDVYEYVVKAETMPGYVWFRWTRKPRQPFTEDFGWAPTRRLARWRLRRSNR